jgi:hypothetical protein
LQLHRSNSNRCFFFIQAAQYLNEYSESLPEVKPTPEEVASGLTRISEVFGFSSTLFHEAERMSIPPEDFCNDWSAREFWHLVRLHAWESDAQREYSRIMGEKIK